MAQEAGMVKPPGQSNGQADTNQARSATPIGASASAERAQAVQTETAVKPTPVTASATKVDFAAEREAVVVDYEKVPIGGPDNFAKSMAMKSAKAREDAVAGDAAQQAKLTGAATEDKVDTQAAARVQADRGGDVEKGEAERTAQMFADDKAAKVQSAEFFQSAAPDPVTERPEPSTEAVGGQADLTEAA